jgi:chemotaxis protein MotB
MNDEPAPIMIPEWVVTFGDMMSLLLTFFIMLVSMSEIKSEDKYKALVESMRDQFGYSTRRNGLAPVDVTPLTSEPSVIAATAFHAENANKVKGHEPNKTPIGEEPLVRILRPGQATAVGSVVFFETASSELDAAAKKQLDVTASLLIGKPQKIEVRGHCNAEITARTAGTDTGMTLAFQRAMSVMQYLKYNHGIPAARFRISMAGDSEPIAVVDDIYTRQNSRAEVFLLTETVDSPQGDASKKNVEAEMPLEPQGKANG